MGLREDAIALELLALLPPGDALPQAADSELATLLRVSAKAIDRLEELAEFVELDLDPRTTTLFLEDWERVLDLPDCGELADTTAGRRAAVVEKYTREGTLTPSDLIAAAAVLGFAITISEHWPYAPRSDGSPLTDAHIFDVDLPSLDVTYFRVGESRSGDSLGAFGDPQLVCLLDSRKPAHLNYRLTTPP